MKIKCKALPSQATHLMARKDRVTALQWCRFFYNTDPYVYANINMGATRLDIKINSKDDAYVGQVKEYIYEVLLNILKCGEVFIMHHDSNQFYTFLEPELVNVNRSMLNNNTTYEAILPQNQLNYVLKKTIKNL